MRTSLAWFLALTSLAGCSCETPPGTDAGPLDAPARTDVSVDAPIPLEIGPPLDAPDDAAAEPDAPADAAVCTRDPYPIRYTPSRAELTALEGAVVAFRDASGATTTFNDATGAVTGFEGGSISISLDPTIADPCEHALAGLLEFFADHYVLMHLPTGMTMRACHYDALTDAEIVRLSGGTYGGRPLLGIGNDLVVHVTRGGLLRYFGGDYLPAWERPGVEPCFTPDGLGTSVIGDDLGFQRFAGCVLGAPGSIPIDATDTRTVGGPSLYVDRDGTVRFVREVEVLLAAARVTTDEVNSDLFCCTDSSVVGCVGKVLIVDEVTGEILEQVPRCHTC